MRGAFQDAFLASDEASYITESCSRWMAASRSDQLSRPKEDAHDGYSGRGGGRLRIPRGPRAGTTTGSGSPTSTPTGCCQPARTDRICASKRASRTSRPASAGCPTAGCSWCHARPQGLAPWGWRDAGQPRRPGLLRHRTHERHG